MGAPRNPFLMARSRPLIVGHRGVQRLHQENTLAGFERAVALGVPAVELDARLTADGRAVVLHDRDVARLTGGTGMVDQLTWDQLSRLRIRRELPVGTDAYGQAVTVRYARAEPIPLLADVLAALAGKVAVNIELKIDGARWWRTDVGTVVGAVVAEAGVAGQVVVTSFDPRKLLAARRVHAAIEVGFCYDDTMLAFAAPVIKRLPASLVPWIAPEPALPGYPARPRGRRDRRLLAQLLEHHLIGRLLPSRLVGAEHTLIGHDTVARLHRLGVAVGAYTLFPMGSTTGKPIPVSATSVDEARRLIDLGLDWIETDDPERLLGLLAQAAPARAAAAGPE